MQQKELATLLGISPAMVSRLAKRGMPTDTLERAERWRRRHLEPGRVKGNRQTPSQTTVPAAATPARAPKPPDYVPDADVEAVADLAHGALARGNQDTAAARIAQLRGLLAQTAPGASPRLTVRVWLALLAYTLHEEAEIRNAPDMGAYVTPGECGAMIGGCSMEWPWPGSLVIFEACDFDGHSIHGWPDDEGEDATE